MPTLWRADAQEAEPGFGSYWTSSRRLAEQYGLLHALPESPASLFAVDVDETAVPVLDLRGPNCWTALKIATDIDVSDLGPRVQGHAILRRVETHRAIANANYAWTVNDSFGVDRNEDHSGGTDEWIYVGAAPLRARVVGPID